jgi:predicted TIM-barrel fold metal-dependent hydrolase
MTALCQPARRVTKPPRDKAPPGAVDCHFHVFGPDARYPYSPKRGYTPPEALVADYAAMIAVLGIERMVIVQPSVYGTDNRCSLDSMAALGRARCRMVAVVDESVSDAELEQMDAAGVRGVRFNLVSRGGLALELVEAVARRASCGCRCRSSSTTWDRS